jgi:uncharacterized protein YbaR (Trm112 family)
MVKPRQNDYSRRIEALGHAAPMDKRLLDILCDPVSKIPLKLLSKLQLDLLNRAIRSNEIQTSDGRPVSGQVDSGLVTIDGKVIYRIDDGIPVLLADEGIGTAQLHDFPR